MLAITDRMGGMNDKVEVTQKKLQKVDEIDVGSKRVENDNERSFTNKEDNNRDHETDHETAKDKKTKEEKDDIETYPTMSTVSYRKI